MEIKKILFWNSSKNDCEQIWNSMPKGYQNGGKIDVKSHQKSADPLVGRARPLLWGEVSSPLPPSALGALPGHFQTSTRLSQTVQASTRLNGSYSNKNHATQGLINFSIKFLPAKKDVSLLFERLRSNMLTSLA